jgi:hypothetical protein
VSVDVKAEAFRRDTDRTQRLMMTTAWAGSCRSWYKTATGRITNNWPSWTLRYWLDTLRVRENDLVFHQACAPATDENVTRGGARQVTGSAS